MNEMNEIRDRIDAAGVVCTWLAKSFDTNWQSNNQEPYVMLSVPESMSDWLPEDVMEWADRHQQSPTSAPRFALPAGILAKYFLGQAIPRQESQL